MTTIDTPLGAVRGQAEDGYLAFRGLRYAQAPLGEMRYRPPVPVTPWSGVYDATEFGPSAPQPDFSALNSELQLPVEPTDEDCLFVNVHTPAADGERRPVLFWIHGGGYIVGSGRVYDGAAFVREHDVVVVTINYRMGAPGFMHVGHLDPALGSSVNNGLLDQICALKWNRDNIAAFGGDPDNVTIFGESAGGTATAMLLGCPRAEGLFHKAIVHSPHVDLIPVGQGHIDFTNQCIRRLGGDPERNGLDTLQNAPIDALAALALPDMSDPNAFKPSLGLRTADNVGFSPAIDGDLIPAPVAETVAARGSANVPFLGGGCRHEGTLFPTTVGFQEHDEASATALFEAAGVDGQQALAVYERFAPGETPTRKLVYALADTMFRNSMLRILDAAADAGASCWNWMCTWESDLPGLRATHAIELPFLWDWIDHLPAMKRFAGSGAPADLGPAMRAYWANFARTGTPSAPGEPEWPAHNTTDRPVLLLDAERRIATQFDEEVRQLWFERLGKSKVQGTTVVSVDPALAKMSTIFDGRGYSRKDGCELREYVKGLANRPHDTVLCWDAPLTGPVIPNAAGTNRHDFTQRRIEQFFSRGQSGFKVPPGISVRPYSGLAHWTITRSLLGLPRTGPYDCKLNTLPFRLLPDRDGDPNDSRPSVAEIHPAVAAWLWCKDHRPEGSFWNYKEDSRIRDELWKIILDLTGFRELSSSTPKNDDQFDSAIGYILGHLYTEDHEKPATDRRVILLGDQSTGSFLLPYSECLNERWTEFSRS